MKQPTIVVRIGDSYLTKSEDGEVLETVETVGSQPGIAGTEPDWDQAGLVDHRGAGGRDGMLAIFAAFDSLERNAELVGEKIERVER